MKTIEDFIEAFSNRGKLIEDGTFAQYTSWRVGGPIRLVFFPNEIEDAIAAFQYIKKHDILYKIIGKGSNLLAADATFPGIVVNLTKIKANFEQISETRFTIGAGYALQSLCRLLAKMGYTGHEFLSGIPGTIGGAIVMNAGTSQGEIKDILIQATIVDAQGNMRKLSNTDLAFGYRTSKLKTESEFLIVASDFYFEKEAVAGTALAEIQSAKKIRKEKQPLEFPSCGSVFRNPENNYAGALIEAVGLKGYRIGDAQISEKHANFIINLGKATAADIKALILQVQETIQAEKGISLHTEVEFFNFE